MTLTRLTTATVLLAFAAVSPAFAKPVKLAAETNFRKAPGTKSEVVTLIPKGETVEVGDCDAGWCKVTFNGQDGYAIARNLGQASAGAPRRVARHYTEGEYEPVEGPGGPPVVYEDGPVYYGGYYPYAGAYWYGGGYRRGWHYRRHWW